VKLNREKEVMIAKMLSDGSSIRSVERVTEIHRDTILRVLHRIGEHCESVMNSHFQSLIFNALEIDEAWTFLRKKERNCTPMDFDAGDRYVYIAQDPETKLIPLFSVGRRTEETTNEFITELASRVHPEIQLSTDGFQAYRPAIAKAFGPNANYMQIVKKFHEKPSEETRKYSPPSFVGVDRVWVSGSPSIHWMSTSHVEAQNTGLRTALRRMARLTLCFSKKFENLLAALRLHFAVFNFVRKHATLKTCPAHACGLIEEPWRVSDLVPV